MNLNILKIVFVILILPLSLCNAQDRDKVATVGFVFLELPTSARSMALGETGLSVSDYSSEGLFINPALIALSENEFSMNVSYANWYIETSHQTMGITYNLSGYGSIGLHAVYFDFGEIEKTQNQLVGKTLFLGTYSANAYAVGLTFAKNLTQQFSFGATAKYVRETIDKYSADNIIYDFGFLYQLDIHNIRIGAALKNFGLESKYVEQKFKMPQILKMGISGEILGNLESQNHITLIIEAAHPNDLEEHIQIGLEAVFIDLFSARTGYKFGYEYEDLSLGLGLKFRSSDINFQFDAAFMKHDFLNETMRYTLSMGF
jgi:hypothetical protein